MIGTSEKIEKGRFNLIAECPDKEELTLKLVDAGDEKIGKCQLVVQNQQTYLVLTGLRLKTGYKYRFALSQNADVIFQTQDFEPKGLYMYF